MHTKMSIMQSKQKFIYSNSKEQASDTTRQNAIHFKYFISLRIYCWTLKTFEDEYLLK